MKKISFVFLVVLTLLSTLFSLSSCDKMVFAPVFMAPDTLFNGITAKLNLTRKVVYDYDFISEAPELSFYNPSGRDWYVDVDINDNVPHTASITARNLSINDKEYTFTVRTVLMPWHLEIRKVYEYTQDGVVKYTSNILLADKKTWQGLYRVAVYDNGDNPERVTGIETASMGLDRFASVVWECDKSNLEIWEPQKTYAIFKKKDASATIRIVGKIGRASSEIVY